MVYAPEPMTSAFTQLREQPEIRTIRIDQAGSHLGDVMEPVSKKDGWDSHGKHYEPGELAPMTKVFDHLKGYYEYWRDDQRVRRMPWGYGDFAFWRREYLHQGGLNNATKVMLKHRIELLNRDNREYGIGTRRRLRVGRQ